MSGSALAAALAAVEDVRRFVAISEREVDAVRQLIDLDPPLVGIASEWATDVASFRNGKKYDYACAVVLLYGALERFVEDSTEEHIAGLARGTELYGSLPEKMRTSHFAHVLSHLQRARDARYDGVATAQQLASAFSGCLQGSVPYEFIAESMLHHTANFRPPVVDEFLARVGVDSASRRAVASESFSAYLDAAGRVAPNDRPEAALDLVVELVSRRNEVSHGDISSTLAPSELIPYCDQVEAYCKGLANVLDDSLLAHLVQFHGIDHGNPIAVYNHNIVCVQSKGAAISTGASLAIRRTDGSWFSATVANIQIDGNDVVSTPEGMDIAVGLQIDGRCRDTYVVRSGVLEIGTSKLFGLPPTSKKERRESSQAAEPADAEVWRARRDEAYAWLVKNGGGCQDTWLVAEHQRCCDALAQAEQAART
jgi:hypothetical protein